MNWVVFFVLYIICVGMIWKMSAFDETALWVKIALTVFLIPIIYYIIVLLGSKD